MSSIKPDNGGSQIDSPEECFGPFGISGGNTSALLELGEEVVKQVSGFIPFLIVYPRHCAVFPWREDGLHPTESGYQRLATIWLDAIKARYEQPAQSAARPDQP